MKDLKGMTYIGLLIVLLVSINMSPGLHEEKEKYSHKLVKPPFIQANTSSVADSVVSNMTIDEKLGQLFMVAAYSNKDEKHKARIEKLIKEYHIGGLIFMQGSPSKQINLVNNYQKISETPLMIAMDAEWGPSMRLDSTVLYPRQMMLGAVKDNNILYKTGKEYARQLKALGVNINFAPVADINTDPDNPVINSRSYGENKSNVTTKAFHFSKGLQDEKVLAVAKHFPGHGDTDKDSHKILPVLPHTLSRLDSVELYPFRKLINTGIGGIMVAHLLVPGLDSTENRPSTLSPFIVNDLLKNKMNFKGLVFTDALNMNAVTDHYKPGEAALNAFIAGNDVLLFPEDVPGAVKRIKKQINEGNIKIDEIDKRVKKILSAKQWMGLMQDSVRISNNNVVSELNSTNANLIRREISENAVTLVHNKNKILPIKNIGNKEIASLDIGSGKINRFQKRLKSYTNVPAYNYKKDVANFGKEQLAKQLSQYDHLIISLTGTNRSPASNFGISSAEIDFIKKLSINSDIILNHFGNPYALNDLYFLTNLDAVIVSYNEREITQDISAQMIFGGLPYKGQLPVSIKNVFKEGSSNETNKIRLSYTDVPEQVGINSGVLYKVDSLVNKAIDKKATPGAQVLAARKGNIFFQKCYGHHTYKKKKQVKISDIYDIASVTKITATTISLMHLYDKKVFRLNDSIGGYLDFLKGSNKANLRFSDILTHQAGLKPWIPFYKETISDKNYNKYYSPVKDTEKTVKVAEKMFSINNIKDTILNMIRESKLRKRNGYRYSDLGFYIMKEFIEETTGNSLENYADSLYYKPLGAVTTGYKPLERFHKSEIIPTEHDKIFRKQLLQGYVHDQGAAMLGGVSGHAGVFSNAGDLAKIMQLLLNKGVYGGKRYIKKSTVEMFSSPLNNPEENRRGLGFDKPVIDEKDKGPACNSASPESFGHSGFTGILAWVDPKTDILYIFMSNRVYPKMDNKKLLKMNTRTNVQQVFYNAIED